jgi:hypothetical protein
MVNGHQSAITAETPSLAVWPALFSCLFTNSTNTTLTDTALLPSSKENNLKKAPTTSTKK